MPRGNAQFGMTAFDNPAARFCSVAVVIAFALFAFSPAGHVVHAQEAAQEAASGESATPSHETFTIRGRVVWMTEALDRLFGIRTVPEAKERLLAIETPEGRLHPIVEDIRGRSFRRDPRLRVDGEFLVRRYEGSPMVQVIRIYEITDQGKFELDYWCEICAIAMFELKPCDCCQGPIELRRREAANE